MVPSMGTQAEKQRMPTTSSEINHLSNHITTPERTRPTETNNGYETINPTASETSESNNKQLESDQESKISVWSETDSSTEMSDFNEINIEEHEETRKQFQSKLGKKKGITLASWNIRGKNNSAHNSKWPRIAKIRRLKRITTLEKQEAKTTKEDTTQIEAVVSKIKIITNRQYSSKMGVAFAINKDLVNENNLHHEIMIPNRASKL